MKVTFTVFFMLSLATLASAQTDYNVSLIPKELMPYASAVVRSEEVTYQVKDLDNVFYHIKRAVTVLNKNGEDNVRIVVFYDKKTSIKYIRGAIYNEFGKPVDKFTEKQFGDHAAINDFSLYEDNRVKTFSPGASGYPYTVEYEYEVRYRQSLNFDDWQPNPTDGLSVEKSSYTFSAAPGFAINYKQINLPSQVIIGTNKEGLKTHTWQVSNLKAFKDEPYSPNAAAYLSAVKIAPVNFKYENISGSFNNWNELGKWNYDKLLANRQTLPAETIDHIKAITKDIADEKQKAKTIYEYMQGKTRYISIQVGIGGYQPFLASEVDRTNYGDCKALVNYTQALFMAAGIPSWYCVVQAGREKVNFLSDFASMAQGNHVILCLPFKNDTTFLECTDQKIPFGFLGDFTDDRTVLACTPNGGKLMHTPKYTAQANIQIRKADFTINDSGELTGNINSIFKGTQYDNREGMLDEPRIEQLKAFSKLYPAINNLDINAYDFKEHKAILPAIVENIKLSARDFATTDNGRLYFSINPVNRTGRAPREVRNRVTDLYINRGYTDDDEVVYTIPPGYKLDLNELHVFVEKPFGKFTATMDIKDDHITFKRHIQLIDGTYKKELYNDFVNFYQQVAEADNYNVTLVKK